MQPHEDNSFDNTFEKEVIERLTKIEVKLDGVEDLKKTCYENQRTIISITKDNEDQEKRITSIEDNNRWLWRTVVAELVTAVIGVIILLVKEGIGI